MSYYARVDVSVLFIGLLLLYDKGRKQKEVQFMLSTHAKKVNFWNEPIIDLPNAATRRQILHKIMDTALLVASCVGVMAIMLFFVVISL